MDDILQLPSSPWTAKIVVTQDLNPHRRKWLCVDFSQTINVYTKLDTYPLHNIYDIVNRIGHYSVFSTFSLKSAYHQVDISLEDNILKLMKGCMNPNVSLWMLQIV